MRKICQYCENRDKDICKECKWPTYLKYPTNYKGKKFRSTKGLDEVID